jgi:hypothetical protein
VIPMRISTETGKGRDAPKDAPARWRSALPLGTSDASEVGLLSGTFDAS